MTPAPDPRPRPLDHLAERGEGDAPALVLRGRTLNHQDLRTRVGRLAAWLASRASEGERVASWAAKGEATCLLPLACARAGIVHVPINPLLKRMQVAHILADSGASLLIASRARLASLEADDVPPGCAVVVEEEFWSEVDAHAPLGPSDRDPAELAAILYTSGSTGKPKGVMLPWRSIEANTEMVDALLHLRPSDVMLGVLPFFHTFGYTITLWTMLAMGVGAVFHTNPLESRVIGRLMRERGVTIVLGTPTLLRAYMRRLEPEDFATVDIVAAGSERLPNAVIDAFEEKIGVRPFQGYGATELGPIVSANVPASRAQGDPARSLREGTVGRPALGVRVQVRDPETGKILGPNERGVLWVTGPHVMLGYLNRPDLTEQVVVDGWYNTGDVVTIDEDGFITIVGRESRFAKIGGEQVPFAAIEEALAALTGGSEDGAPRAVVTAVPDDASGERLVVVHTELDATPAELVKGMADLGLPRLFLPSPADFHPIDVMPLIGIGKVDLEAINRIALDAAATRRAKAKS